jgi:WD40 repeat protein
MQRLALLLLTGILLISGGISINTATLPSALWPPSAAAAADCSDSWQTVASRTMGQGARTILYDTVAIAPDNIWAVGSSSLIDTRYDVPLIMRSNGTSWESVPAPAIAGDIVRLYGIAAVSANDIWAVGAAFTLNSRETVILQWNGANWSRVASPNGAQGSTLYDVAALAANDVWAVGTDGGQSLITHWNGTAWTKIDYPPSLSAGTHGLFGVTMIAANDGWAVGASSVTGGALTLHWDGAAWSVIPSPTLPNGAAYQLRAVDALATNDVWAVGDGDNYLFAQHWDGLSWSEKPFLGLPPDDYKLNSVVALAPNNIWAIGSGAHQARMFHWDGNAWRNSSPVHEGYTGESLNGATALNASDIWAVGHVDVAYNDGPMLVRRFAPSVAFTGPSFHRTTSPDMTIPIALTSTAPYTVSVHFATSSASALAGVDYADTSGTLQIAPCDYTTSFPVTLLDSPTWKPAAYANMVLDSPSGAALGATASAKLFTANIGQAPAGLAIFLPSVYTSASQVPTRIAYVGVSNSGVSNNQNWDIFTMNADGSDRRQLTNNPARDFDPSWSPDGQHLAFVSERDGNPEIYVMNADGSGQTRLTASPGEDVTPAWSPDGRRIVFASRRKGARLLFVMESDGRAQTQLTSSTSSGVTDDLAPAWSPNGQLIAFTSKRGLSTYADIYSVNANGSGLRRLTNTLDEDLDPAWSPDGQTIAYASGNQPRYQLMAMRADGSQQRSLNPNYDTGGHPSWSPDGRSVVYDSLGDSLGITDITNTAPKNIAPHSYRELGPVWAPR